jgi:hypothetical protein
VDHWRTPYLGLRDIPPGLDDFELTPFFSYSAAELRCIESRRLAVHRLAVALLIGFIRMSEHLRRVAPTNIEGVNLRGTFDFPVDRYAQRILPSSIVNAGSARLRSA